jgi:hypothetical protein
MERNPPSEGTRESTFRFLFGLGTAIFLFGALFALTKHTDRVPDLIMFVAAAALFIAALLVGQLPNRMGKAASDWRSGPVSTTILVIEVILSASYIKDFVIYLLQRR